MLIRTAKSHPVFQFILLFAVSLALAGKDLITKGLFHGPTWAGWLLHLSWALAVGFMASRHRLSRNPGLIALIFFCLDVVHSGMAYRTILWSYPLFILSIHYCMSIYGQEKPYPAIFNASFFWSALTVFCPELLFSLPCFFIILLSYSATSWREWASTLLGMGAPYLLLAAYDFLFNTGILAQNWEQAFNLDLPAFHKELILPGILLLCCMVTTLLSIFSLRQSLQDVDMSERHKSSALTALFIYLSIFCLGTNLDPALCFPLFIPLAFFCTKFLVNTKNEKVKDWIFLGILLTSLLGMYL